MRLGTSTNFFTVNEQGYIPYAESVRRCVDAGFYVIDVNFCHALRPAGDLAADNWESIMYDLRNTGEKLNVDFVQSHPVFVGDIREASPEVQEIYDEMMKRSIMASAILGVKWAIMHPVDEKQRAFFDTEASIKKNREYFDSYVELAIKHGVGIAFENMVEGSRKRRFACTAQELKALVESYNDPLVGACWDFGHGNLLYPDQTFALCTLGSHLKATHVNDNRGSGDDHLFPFHGTIDWHSVMPVLKEIGYEGDFVYETHNEFNRLPDRLRDSIAKIGYDIGMYCLSLV
jgi:L-ribulose-5-phosphate 3-epimerase